MNFYNLSCGLWILSIYMYLSLACMKVCAERLGVLQGSPLNPGLWPASVWFSGNMKRWSSWSSCIASVARFLHPWNKKQTETWRRSISHFMFFSVCSAVFWLAACCDRRHKDCSILSLFVDFQLFSESVFVIWFLFEAAGRLANVPHRLRDVFIYSSGFRLQQMMRYGS